jgi:putative ABC transport system permease protein
LKIEDAEAIRREMPDLTAVSEEVSTITQVAAGNQNWSTRILGESADYFDLRRWPLIDGAPFTAQDVRSANKVCVIGQTTARQVYGNDSPIGQVLRVKNVPFTITGLLTAKGFSTQGPDQDDVVVMPYTSAMKRVLGGTTLRAINVQVGNANELNVAQQQIISLLRQRHNVRPGRDDDFTVRTQQEIADAATATTDVMTGLLGAIAGVSLVVGGIGIMNIMLANILERTREIGVRRAVGARQSDIVRQFVVEAILISFVGGSFGIIFGFVMSRLIAWLAGWSTIVTAASILLAFMVSITVGLVFGIYPAVKAARLDPVEAIRYE